MASAPAKPSTGWGVWWGGGDNQIWGAAAPVWPILELQPLSSETIQYFINFDAKKLGVALATGLRILELGYHLCPGEGVTTGPA